MLKKILLFVVVMLAVFLGYVSTRPSAFSYSRSGVINAPAEAIFPYVSQLQKGSEWSPYEKKDPAMKKTFAGTDGQPGAVMEFDGNKDVGAGKLEILAVTPNQMTQIKLTMTKPFHGENLIQYTLSPETGGGTRFTWSMSGDGGFLGKLMSVLIDCEKMVTADFEIGISNLKNVVESRK